MGLILGGLLTRSARWKFLLAGWIVVAALALWGMREAADFGGSHRSWLDDLYQLTDVFGFGFDLSLGSANWQLQVARFLGPAIFAGSLVQAFMALTRDRASRWRARRRRGHVVVCGLGDRGTRIAKAVAAGGQHVVAIELDGKLPAVEALRAADIPVVVGDAREEHVLEQARVHLASEVVITCGLDARNAEVVSAVTDLAERTGDVDLDCNVHLGDAGLCALLRHQALRTAASGVRYEFFDVYTTGARMLLERHPLDAAAGDRPVHLLVVGLGQLGLSLVEAAVRWHATSGREDDLTVTVVAFDATLRLEALLLGQPGLADHAQLSTIDLDIEAPTREAAELARSVLTEGEVTTVAVCFDDDVLAVRMGLLARRLLGTRPAEVIVRTSGAKGIATLASQGGSAGIVTFPLLDRACTRELVEGGTHELVAMALHRDYVARGSSGGFAVAWDDLDPEARASNRRAADRLFERLAAIGCDLVPLGGWGAEDVVFTEAELDTLARMEHERWRAEREEQGWRYGERRDDSTRENPLLIPWDRLAPEARERSRESARRIPQVLASVGLEVLRTRAAVA